MVLKIFDYCVNSKTRVANYLSLLCQIKKKKIVMCHEKLTLVYHYNNIIYLFLNINLDFTLITLLYVSFKFK